MELADCLRTSYYVGLKDQRRQARQYAISGDKQGHEMFELGGQKVCNAAMCALVGFSSGFWKAQKEYRNQRIVLEEEHGNKVRRYTLNYVHHIPCLH